MKFVPRNVIFALPLLLLGLTPLHAAQDSWTGANSSDWFDGGNWSLGNPPLATDNAHLGTVTVPSAVVTIDSPGAVAKNVFVGDLAATTGDLSMHNFGSLNTNLDLDVGENGGGTFVMNDFSQANIGSNVNIADQIGSTGDATVRDDAVMTVAGNLRVGNGGAGTLTIRDFGSVSANNVNVGVAAGSNGAIDVSGSPAVAFNLASTGNMTIGDQGTGMITIHDGGIVITSGNATIGNAITGIGTVIVRGENSGQVSRWSTGGNLTVGDLGMGDLEVHNGGEVDVANNLRVARQAGSTGTVLVEGNGPTSGTASILNVTNNAFVGGDTGGVGGQGMLTIKNNGIVNVGGSMTVWGIGSGARSELDVDATYTLNVGGTLNFNGGALRFLGDGVDFINDATLNNIPGPDLNGMHLIVTDSNTGTMDGLLSGNGHLVKEGTGTLILNNINNTYSGGTDINNGTLQVGAASPVVGIPPFASVFGFGDVNLNNAATLQTTPGTGTFYVVNGNFNANGSAPDAATLVVNMGGSAATGFSPSDFMGVVGNANLTTGTGLFAHRLPGAFFANGDQLEFLGTIGTVNGTFFQQQGDLIPNDFNTLIQPFVSYNVNGTEVDAVFGFAASFASVAKTPNQIAVANALDNAVAMGCIVNATNVLGNQPINLLRHDYDLIAPEELASMYEASFSQGMVQALNIQHRLDDIRWGSTGFCADGFVIQDNHGYTKNDGKSVADKNPVEETAPPNYRWGSFITGTGELSKVGDEDANGDHNGYQLNNASFTMGVDYRVSDHFAVGLVGGYTHTTGMLVDDGRLNTDGGRMGLFATYYTGGFYVDASATGGWNEYDTRRTALFGQETGSTDGAEFDGMVAVGYDWKKDCWIFGPYADFEYSYVEFNAFSEDDRPNSTTSSLIPLHYPDQNQSAYRTNLGFRIAHEQVYKPGEGLNVVPEVRAAWRHDFGDTSYAIDSNFIGCDDTFTVHGPYVGRDSALVDIGLTAYCTQQLSAYIFYQGQFGRDNYNNNAISGGMRFAF